jgi:hypothetical protein
MLRADCPLCSISGGRILECSVCDATLAHKSDAASTRGMTAQSDIITTFAAWYFLLVRIEVSPILIGRSGFTEKHQSVGIRMGSFPAV